MSGLVAAEVCLMNQQALRVFKPKVNSWNASLEPVKTHRNGPASQVRCMALQWWSWPIVLPVLDGVTRLMTPRDGQAWPSTKTGMSLVVKLTVCIADWMAATNHLPELIGRPVGNSLPFFHSAWRRQFFWNNWVGLAKITGQAWMI